MRSELDENRNRFDELLDVAEAELLNGQSLVAAVYCQIAANYAWANHCGIFASHRLESILRSIGAGLHTEISHGQPVGKPSDAPTVRTPHVSDARRVLHVASEIYPSGGHTRMIARWLLSDRGSRHDLLLTRQSPPSACVILAGLGVTDSQVISVVDRPSILDRARAMRTLASGYDFVVLHIHPDDVVPTIAFAASDGVLPIVMVNHADHVFWVGAGVSSLVLNLRTSGQGLAVTRRGVDPTRCHLTTRPLSEVERTLSRSEAKAKLGLDPSRLVLASVAAGSKYQPIDGVGLIDLVEPVLKTYSSTSLIIAGLPASASWLARYPNLRNSLHAIGEVSDPSLVHEAADIYLDSYPFASLTSLLEAGSLSTPLITFRGHGPAAAVLGADSPGLDGQMLTPSTPEEFRTCLGDLIENPDRRRWIGNSTRSSIVSTHSNDRWTDDLEQMYSTASQGRGVPTLPRDDSHSNELDRLVLMVQRQAAGSDGIAPSIERNLGLFPKRYRFNLVLQRSLRGHRPRLRSILAPRTIEGLRAARARAATCAELHRQR